MGFSQYLNGNRLSEGLEGNILKVRRVRGFQQDTKEIFHSDVRLRLGVGLGVEYCLNAIV